MVTEYVIKHYPAASNVVFGSRTIKPRFGTNESHEASWNTTAAYLSHLPDLMDAQLAGAATASTGNSAPKFFTDLASQQPFNGIAVNQVFWALNTTAAAVEALIHPVIVRLNTGNSSNSSVEIIFSTSTFDKYTTFYSAISGDNVAGGKSVTSSRLLGRRELIDTPRSDVVQDLKNAMASQAKTEGTYATIGLQGGPGVRNRLQKGDGSPFFPSGARRICTSSLPVPMLTLSLLVARRKRLMALRSGLKSIVSRCGGRGHRIVVRV